MKKNKVFLFYFIGSIQFLNDLLFYFNRQNIDVYLLGLDKNGLKLIFIYSSLNFKFSLKFKLKIRIFLQQLTKTIENKSNY